MAVDLTRPMFSDARCALVDFAPDLDIKATLPRVDAVRAGFVANLKAAPQPLDPRAAELLANLSGTATPPATRATNLLTACSKRSPAGLAADLTENLAIVRNRLRKHDIAEAPELLPVDDFKVDDAMRLDDNCRLLDDDGKPVNPE
jgi:hypothetical protein